MADLFPDSVLLIFCKAPLAGQVKTRLQPALSAEQAVSVHRQLSQMTLKRAFEQPLCPVILYCAPDATHPFFRQCASDYAVSLQIQQGEDLGARMHHALSDALSQYQHALLMGCDCPSLAAKDLQQALLVLKNSHDAVIAPAEDGGYVLIGLNKPQPHLFDNMAWGTDQVMKTTRQRAKQLGLNLFELELQWDVDTIEDWERYLGLQSD